MLSKSIQLVHPDPPAPDPPAPPPLQLQNEAAAIFPCILTFQ